MKYDVVIIGGGIVGMATADAVLKQKPGAKVLVLEKESRLCAHQTGHNSGVIHSGIYYKPGSYKAKNCVHGRRELVAFAKQHGIAHDICGKIIVAMQPEEVPRLDKIMERGLANGIEDM